MQTTNYNTFDLIGDIHGHADHLVQLLDTLGYENINGIYQQKGRQVIFVGDYIDRGPKIRETLQIVKGMVDHGHAIALMGNHEYNAICFNTPTHNGGYLRKHTDKNVSQHKETLRQFENHRDEYDEYIRWFLTLPLYYENENIRAVHATWDAHQISHLHNKLNNQRLTYPLVHEASDKSSILHQAIEITLKGKEAPLPSGESFFDKDGHERTDIRIEWWQNPQDKSYKQMSVLKDLTMDDIPYKSDDDTYYGENEKPVFFGHYWLKGKPNLYRGNICCLDYSVAKGGYLTAYRYDGESTLDREKLVFV